MTHRRAELSLEPLTADGDLVLALAPEQLLARLGVTLDANARVFLDESVKGGAQLVQVLFGLWLDRHRKARPGELDRGQSQRPLARAERVTGAGMNQLGDGTDLAGADFAGRLLLLAVQHQHLADALFFLLVRVPDVVV